VIASPKRTGTFDMSTNLVGLPKRITTPPDVTDDVSLALVKPPAVLRRTRTLELSVIIPVYNEEKTIDRIVRRVVAAPYRKEIIIVDDGSTDDTPVRLAALRGLPGITVFRHARNRGKGAAIRTALAHVTGRFCIIQDADLEYDPFDYPLLIEILKRGDAQVVYGSRYMGGTNELPKTKFRLAVHLLNWMVRLLYGAKITDEATCYKAFDTQLLKSLSLRCERFEFCPEVTAKLLKRGQRIIEVPVRFKHRTVAEGKKIGWADGFEAIWALLKYRMID